jgi:hypothetical protein
MLELGMVLWSSRRLPVQCSIHLFDLPEFAQLAMDLIEAGKHLNQIIMMMVRIRLKPPETHY